MLLRSEQQQKQRRRLRRNQSSGRLLRQLNQRVREKVRRRLLRQRQLVTYPDPDPELTIRDLNPFCFRTAALEEVRLSMEIIPLLSLKISPPTFLFNLAMQWEIPLLLAHLFQQEAKGSRILMLQTVTIATLFLRGLLWVGSATTMDQGATEITIFRNTTIGPMRCRIF